MPPLLPEILRCWRSLWFLLPLLTSVVRTNNYDWLLAWTDIPQLLARLVFDDCRFLIVLCRLDKLLVLLLLVRKLLAFGLNLLHQVAVRPGLGQGSQQKSYADKPRDPHDGSREKRVAPSTEPPGRLFHAYGRGDVGIAHLWTRRKLWPSWTCLQLAFSSYFLARTLRL